METHMGVVGRISTVGDERCEAVGAAEGCDLLIFFDLRPEDKPITPKKIAACGSSYRAA
jgi:hypothetical protein